MKYFDLQNERTKTIIGTGIPALALALSLAGVLDNIVNVIGRGHIQEQAIEFLETSEKEATKTFLVLSVAKSEIAVLQSSTAGISIIVEAEVEIGKAFIGLGRRVSCKKSVPGLWCCGIVKPSGHRNTRALKRITGPTGTIEQDRAPGVGGEVPGMVSEGRYQDQRGSGGIGGNGHKRCEGMARFAVQCRKRCLQALPNKATCLGCGDSAPSRITICLIFGICHIVAMR